MKKNLLLIPALLVGNLFAQQSITNPTTGKHLPANASTRSSLPKSSLADRSTPIFSEDFGAGLPATWSVVNNATTTEVWTYTTTGSFNPGGQLNPVGTTASNGYMIFDSDAAGSAGIPEDCDLKTPAINCSSNSTVFLSLNQFYFEYQFDSCYIGVSNDNVTWTYIYSPDTATAGFNTATPNADALTFDISSIAANQATVYVKFHWSGDWDYFWLIDDVKLFQPSATEIASMSIKPTNSEYTVIPLPQASNMTISGTVANMGSSSITGATALLEVIDTVSNAVVFTNTVPVPTLASLATTNVSSSTTFNPTAVGYYRSRITVSATGDFDPLNNIMSSSSVLHVSDSVFARDNGVIVGELGIGAGIADGIIGQNFTISVADQLTSVTFFLTDVMTFGTGTPVWATIHPQVAGSAPGAAIATTDTLTVTTGTIATGGQYFTLKLNGGALNLLPGTYYVGLHEYEFTLTLGTASAIQTSNTVWVSWNTIPTPPAVGGWATADDFGFAVSYALRMNFGPVPLGINDLSNGSEITTYPNPSNGILNIATGSNGTENSIVTIYNSIGEVVYTTQTKESTLNIDLSAQAAGVYFAQVNTKNDVFKKKITITK